MAKIRNKTIQYSVYNRDSGKPKLVGDTSSYTRPSIEALTDTVKGAGLMGEIDLPTLGQIGSMECELAFNKTNTEFIQLAAPKAHKIEVRWVTDILDSAKASIGIEANKEIMTVIPKTAELGDIESNETNEATITFEVLYYQYIVAGKSVLEIDKLNNVYKVNGVDYTAKIRSAL